MEVTLKYSPSPLALLFRGVSILVIVEVTLKYMKRLEDQFLAFRFNPCYSGSNSKIRCLQFDVVFFFHVSILVIVEVTLKSVTKADLMEVSIVFQSLL